MPSEQIETVETISIEPRGSAVGLDLRELWAYRELLYFLTIRDIKIRYKQTAIGVAWAVLQPVVTTAIFTVIFSTWARFETGDVAYPVFVLSALVIWLFVSTSITVASNSFVSNANLVTKVYFPRLIVPFAATLASLFDLMFSVGILLVLMVYYGVMPTSQILMAPVFVALALILATAFGTLLSALTVRYRDVKFALPFSLQVWMIASPIFYPVSMLSEKWRLLYAINPLTGVIDGFRSSLFGLPFNWPIIAVSCVSILVLCLISIVVFKRMEDDFADII